MAIECLSLVYTTRGSRPSTVEINLVALAEYSILFENIIRFFGVVFGFFGWNHLRDENVYQVLADVDTLLFIQLLVLSQGLGESLVTSLVHKIDCPDLWTLEAVDLTRGCFSWYFRHFFVRNEVIT